VDVLSVKMYPHDLLLKCLPESSDILCTHPMFGPESGKDSWAGLPFVYDPVRVHPGKEQRCDDFINIWAMEHCKMVRMGCEEHDSFAASTQFITHTTGKELSLIKAVNMPFISSAIVLTYAAIRHVRVLCPYVHVNPQFLCH